jgi:hypothetical protein
MIGNLSDARDLKDLTCARIAAGPSHSRVRGSRNARLANADGCCAGWSRSAGVGTGLIGWIRSSRTHRRTCTALTVDLDFLADVRPQLTEVPG